MIFRLFERVEIFRVVKACVILNLNGFVGLEIPYMFLESLDMSQGHLIPIVTIRVTVI